jgi:hypothetical protein
VLIAPRLGGEPMLGMIGTGDILADDLALADEFGGEAGGAAIF